MDLSIAIPLYNEEESLRELNRRLKKILSTLGGSYEILYINDGIILVDFF